MKNRFKGLHLIGCLKTMERLVTLYRRQWSRTFPRKRKAKRQMVVWGGLTNRWEKKRSEGKGEKESDTHLNAEVQRITRRDKKAFLTDECKEIQENNRMGKTRDLFKKITDIKGPFHAKMGTIKDRNGMGLTEAENIKKRWQEHTELYKKILWPR